MEALYDSTIIPHFEDLTFEEMEILQGQGDMQAETTPVCIFAAGSTYACAVAAVGIIETVAAASAKYC